MNILIFNNTEDHSHPPLPTSFTYCGAACLESSIYLQINSAQIPRASEASKKFLTFVTPVNQMATREGAPGWIWGIAYSQARGRREGGRWGICGH